MPLSFGWITMLTSSFLLRVPQHYCTIDCSGYATCGRRAWISREVTRIFAAIYTSWVLSLKSFARDPGLWSSEMCISHMARTTGIDMDRLAVAIAAGSHVLCKIEVALPSLYKVHFYCTNNDLTVLSFHDQLALSTPSWYLAIHKIGRLSFLYPFVFLHPHCKNLRAEGASGWWDWKGHW